MQQGHTGAHTVPGAGGLEKLLTASGWEDRSV